MPARRECRDGRHEHIGSAPGRLLWQRAAGLDGEARTRYLLENGADGWRALVPRAYRDKAATAISNTRLSAEQLREATGAINALSTPSPPASGASTRGPVYKPDDKHELDRLIQQQQD